MAKNKGRYLNKQIMGYNVFNFRGCGACPIKNCQQKLSRSIVKLVHTGYERWDNWGRIVSVFSEGDIVDVDLLHDDTTIYCASATSTLYENVSDYIDLRNFDSSPQTNIFQVSLIDITEQLISKISANYEEIYNISAENFESLIHNRICAMGFEAERVGPSNRKDGGIDIVFWPKKEQCPIPFLGAAQVKHHRSPNRKVGPSVLREMAGVLNVPFQFGLVVTNTTFTADAKWFAGQKPMLLRLRDMYDMQRWIMSNFIDDLEWREFPETLELCPGVNVDLTKYFK